MEYPRQRVADVGSERSNSSHTTGADRRSRGETSRENVANLKRQDCCRDCGAADHPLQLPLSEQAKGSTVKQRPSRVLINHRVSALLSLSLHSVKR